MIIKKITTLIILSCSTLQAFASADLHQVRTENALNTSYQPYRKKGYLIKWLYVPEQQDWVLTTLDTKKKVVFIGKAHPDPRHPLPSGTFFWRSQNKNSFVIKLPSASRTQAYMLLHQLMHKTTVQADGRYPSTSVRTVFEKQQNHPERLIRSDFVEDALGISEDVWRLQLKNVYHIDVTRGVLIPMSHYVYGQRGSNLSRNPRAISIFTGNGLSTTSLASYRFTAAENLNIQLAEHNRILGNFSLIQAPQSTDIRRLQVQYPNAFFQIASNFNALEGGMGNRRTTITGMAGKHAVQGEEAAVAVGGASIYRKYYHTPINMLERLSSVFKLGQGSSYQPIIIGLQHPGQAITQKEMGKFQVCVHAGIIVTSSNDDSLSSDGKPVFNHEESTSRNNRTLVCQVLVSAQDLNPRRNPRAHQPDQQAIAQAIQKTIYEATIMAAYVQGDTGTKVILTLVGAGSFANQTSWIADAIERMRNFILVSGLDVRIVLRGGGNAFDARMRALRTTIQQRREELVHDHDAYDNLVRGEISWLNALI